jgi:hydrogenase/urease accessory protein HupE
LKNTGHHCHGTIGPALRRAWNRLGAITAAALTLLAAARPATAHPVPFTYVDVTIREAALGISVIAHVFDLGHDLNVAPPERLLEPAVLGSHAGAIADLVRSRLQIAADGRMLSDGAWSAPEALAERQSIQLRATFDLPAAPGRVGVTALMFPYDPVHQTFVNFYDGGAIATQAILDRARTRIEYYSKSASGAWAVLREFVPAGMRHILSGPDHLVFLFGLLLLGGTMRSLVLIVTAFTAAHVITLALAAFNVVTPSLRFVEPGIALSIVYVGADNLMVRGGRDVRAWIAAAFGFIHGFGFAGVLRDLSLSRPALSWSVASFNLGIELAQILVVLAVASGLAALRARSEWAGRQVLFVGSILVIATGTVWFVQRVFFPGGMA